MFQCFDFRGKVVDAKYDKIVPYLYDSFIGSSRLVSKVNFKCYQGDKSGIIYIDANANGKANVLFPVTYSDGELDMICYARQANDMFKKYIFNKECFYIKNTPYGVGLYDIDGKVLIKPKEKYKDIYLRSDNGKYQRIGQGHRALRHSLYYKNNKGEYKPMNRFYQNGIVDTTLNYYHFFREIFFPSERVHINVY